MRLTILYIILFKTFETWQFWLQFKIKLLQGCPKNLLFTVKRKNKIKLKFAIFKSRLNWTESRLIYSERYELIGHITQPW